MKVENCMCNDVYTVTPNNTVQDCAKIMCNNHIGCIPVCDNSQNIVGLVTDRDIILRGIACDKDIKATPVSDIMTRKVCCCDGDCDITEAEKIMSEFQIRRLPVVDRNNKLIGIITLGNLAQNNDISAKDVNETLENICKCSSKNAE